MLNYLKHKIIGTHSGKKLKEYYRLLNKINDYRDKYQNYTADDAARQTAKFKERLAKGEKLDSLIPEAFSLVRHAATQALGQTHFDVQILGGLALHFGNIAEMKTGEGKTLTATLPIYLNALLEKGVHVVTVNDYLAKRDAKWMGEIFNYLGLSVGLIQHGQSDSEKRLAYAADVTYGTNNEYGFDYLRDNMKFDLDSMMQREHSYAIVDEVDSILIDESRTPLIISGPTEESTEHYLAIQKNIYGLTRAYRNVEKPNPEMIAKFFNIPVSEVPDRLINLKDDTVVTAGHYSQDEKSRLIQLSDAGATLMEERLGSLTKGLGLYDIENIGILHHVNQALKANYIFKRDIDYIVDNNQVKIVDEFTGRIMEGRRFSDGLHQALEAKEGVHIQKENQTLASITFQNYFRKYKKLSGMTGTAITEENEFIRIYNLGVVIIPTNQPMIRNDHPDLIYKTRAAKYRAIIKQIKDLHAAGQPVLVGTDSIVNSEYLSNLLLKDRIMHDVLNAKNHAREAEIIANAGQLGRVTIATNMAGRGTDIQLAPGVVEKGGLFILGTVRHEARRIDLQLRGRSGRQGDPGESRFFLSLEDDLLRIFGGERIAKLMTTLRIDEDEPIAHSLISRAIENAQTRVEAHNFSIRKHLLEYDDIINRQREVIYQQRHELLTARVAEHFGAIMQDVGLDLYHEFFADRPSDQWDVTAFKSKFQILFHADFDDFDRSKTDAKTIKQLINDKIDKLLSEKRLEFGEVAEKIERHIGLTTLDNAWKNHLVAIDRLKEGVGLRGYAQKNPLDEYKKEAYWLFQELMSRISANIASIFFRAVLHGSLPDENRLQPKAKALQMTHEAMPNFSQNTAQNSASAKPKAKPAPLVRNTPKIGRNSPCFCGSGKKYKNCHGRPEAQPQATKGQ